MPGDGIDDHHRQPLEQGFGHRQTARLGYQQIGSVHHVVDIVDKAIDMNLGKGHLVPDFFKLSALTGVIAADNG